MRYPLMLVMVLLVCSVIKANPLLLSSADMKHSSSSSGHTSFEKTSRVGRFRPPISAKSEDDLEEQKRFAPSGSNPLHNR
ncbi:hypothetical protein QJS04_geneDACA002784 [Acorus gramineus]|uniref:Uncharacterized protein n=1 Tax=Acorus gramineus TaxID=55184 RepID=A0AAV9BX99_ACOGR|nr:hypothetical protein QJS04_geneDACA002784 [Acorus gramineus]